MGFGDSPHPSHVEATRQMLAACSRETLRDASRALLSLDLTPGLPSITLPTLVLVGTADVLTPPRDARQIATLIPGAKLVELPGAGHMLMYERADEVDQLIVDFAARLRAARPRCGAAARPRSDHRRSRRPRRALDRRRHRRHRDRVPTRHRRVVRDPRRRARDPRDRAARAGSHRPARRRDRARRAVRRSASSPPTA